jgi:hypothetical protein
MFTTLGITCSTVVTVASRRMSGSAAGSWRGSRRTSENATAKVRSWRSLKQNCMQVSIMSINRSHGHRHGKIKRTPLLKLDFAGATEQKQWPA